MFATWRGRRLDFFARQGVADDSLPLESCLLSVHLRISGHFEPVLTAPTFQVNAVLTTRLRGVHVVVEI
jgi:hypothetical protein